MEITFRKLAGPDAQDFRRLRLECLEKFPDKMGTSVEDEAGQAKLHFEELIEGESAGAFFFGAFADSDLIGMAGFVRDRRIKARHCGELVSMYVKPGFQGRRVGEHILLEVVTAAFDLEGVEQIYLTVFDDNQTAVGLYQKAGFETFGVQPNYFKAGEQYWHRRFMQLTRERFLNHENLDES